MSDADPPSQTHDEPAASPAPAAAVKRSAAKGVVLLVVLLAALCITYLSPLKHLLISGRASLGETLREAGAAGPVVAVLGMALLVAIGCPRLLLCPIAGLAFGFWRGLLWAQLGTLMGAYLTFLFVRWGGQGLVLRRYPRLRQAGDLFGRAGFIGVVLIRQMPLGGFFITALLGLTKLRHRDYLLGTLLGILPQAIPATLIGAGAARGSLQESVRYISIAVLCLVLVWAVLGWFVRTTDTGLARRIREGLREVTGGERE